MKGVIFYYRLNTNINVVDSGFDLVKKDNLKTFAKVEKEKRPLKTIVVIPQMVLGIKVQEYYKQKCDKGGERDSV